MCLLREAAPGTGSFSAFQRFEWNSAYFRSQKTGRERCGLVATTSGLYRFDPRTGQFAVYNSNPDDSNSLSNNRVNSVYVDRSGRIWVGTQNGLNQLDPKTGKFTVYYERDGLAGNVVGCILEDERGDLWMSTNKGVSRFDPLRKTFKNYTVIDGLPGPDLTGWGACFKSPSGEMFFGGFSGATAFHPDKVVDSSYVPPVVLTDFRLSGTPVEVGAGSPLEKSITHATALTLSHEQNSLLAGILRAQLSPSGHEPLSLQAGAIGSRSGMKWAATSVW